MQNQGEQVVGVGDVTGATFNNSGESKCGCETDCVCTKGECDC